MQAQSDVAAVEAAAEVPSQNNIDGRKFSCTSLAFSYLGIDTDLIELLQAKTPLHTIPFPLWLHVLELTALGRLEIYRWGGGTLQEFIQQHPQGRFLAVIEVTDEIDITKRRSHSVGVVDGVPHNVKNTQRQVFRVWRAF